MAVSVNENGRRVGESHPRSRYADSTVAEAQRLVEEGVPRKVVAKILRIPRSTVGAFANGRRRCQTADRIYDDKENGSQGGKRKR